MTTGSSSVMKELDEEEVIVTIQDKSEEETIMTETEETVSSPCSMEERITISPASSSEGMSTNDGTANDNANDNTKDNDDDTDDNTHNGDEDDKEEHAVTAIESDGLNVDTVEYVSEQEEEEDPLNISQRPIVLQDLPVTQETELKEQENELETNDQVNNNEEPCTSTTTTKSDTEPPSPPSPSPTMESLQSQIKTLQSQKSAVEQANLELLDKLSLSSVQISTASDSAMMATELQKSLQDQMTQRAEVEHVLRNTQGEIEDLKSQVKEFQQFKETHLELEGVLQSVQEEKEALEQECKKLRGDRENYESNQIVLSNRLNHAKKKEANVSNAAGKLESVNEALVAELEHVKADVMTLRAGKEKHDATLEKLKKKCVERVKLSEGALVEERNLNEERKKKMKIFVETKAEELRNAKTSNDELRKELDETLGALTSVRGKLEDMTMQYEKLVIRNREIIRDMNRMKKNSEHLHQMGDNLELELHKSAQETEEHKNKRLTAKHELMTILRKLEAEQSVSNKLRDSVKFTFTPKALSQQQLLTESLNNFESQLVILARRLGKTAPVINLASQNEDEHDLIQGNGERNGQSDSKRGTRSELDTYRLLSNLESETQHVSKGIIAFQSAVETLHVLLDDSNEKTCVSALNDFFLALSAARGQPAIGTHGSAHGTASVAIPTDVADDEEDGFAGVTPSSPRGTGSERFGLVSGA